MGERYIDQKKHFVIHGDMQEAFDNYDGTNKSFEEVMKARREKTARGEPYWNTEHDCEMKETAELRSRHPLFKFPARKRR